MKRKKHQLFKFFTAGIFGAVVLVPTTAQAMNVEDLLNSETLQVENLTVEDAEKPIPIVQVETLNEGTKLNINLLELRADNLVNVYNTLGLQGLQLILNQELLMDVFGENVTFEISKIDNGNKEVVQLLNNEKVLYQTILKTPTFKDIDNNYYAKHAIESLYKLGIVTGTTITTFEPNKPITRAQFSAMLARTLEFESKKTLPFTDVKGTWFEKDVQLLHHLGIVNGSTPTEFEPNKPISRQQAAAMLERYMDVLGMANGYTGDTLDFADKDKIADYAVLAVAMLKGMNIIDGKEGNVFDPLGDLTRGQMAKILWNALSLEPKTNNEHGEAIAAVNLNLLQLISFAENLKSKGMVVAKPEIDKEKPVLNVQKQTTEWTNKDVSLSLSANDNLELDYLVLPNGDELELTGVKEQRDYTVTKNGKYTFELVDMAGNKSVEIIEVSNIDKVAPTIEIEVVKELSSATKITLLPIIKDEGSGIAAVDMPVDATLDEVNGRVSVNANKNYVFKATDKAGNVTEAVYNAKN